MLDFTDTEKYLIQMVKTNPGKYTPKELTDTALDDMGNGRQYVHKTLLSLIDHNWISVGIDWTLSFNENVSPYAGEG